MVGCDALTAARVTALLGDLDLEQFEVQVADTLDAACTPPDAGTDEVYLVACGRAEHHHLDLVQRAIESGNTAAFILLTEAVDDDYQHRAQQAGASDSLVRAELTSEDLHEAIRSGVTTRREEVQRIALVTEQVARAQAQWVNRAKDEVLAALSHKLRTPLHAMLGWAHLLREGQLDAVTTRRAIETMVRSCETQELLVEELLDVTHLLNGDLTISPKSVDLADVVTGVCEASRAEASRAGVTLRYAVEAGAPRVLGDPVRLRQVVRILVGNAMKFTPDGGFVDIALGARDDRMWLTVLDSGEGIAAELLPHLFDRFCRDANPTTPADGGVSLAIAHRIVALHGGEIVASSDGPDKGASFSISLPLASTDEVRPHAELGPVRPDLHVLAGARLLVVEDDEASRDYLCSALTLHGAAAVPADSAAAAWTLLHEEHFDAMLADIAMPGEDGLSLIRRIRSANDPRVRAMPAAALSAHAGTNDHGDAVTAGFGLHLAKPIAPRELLAVVGQLLARR